MIINKQSVFAGLGTSFFSPDQAGMFTIEVKTTEIPVSNVIITISQSGSQSVSVSSPTTSPVQDKIFLHGIFNCAIGDILSVTVSSSNSADILVNQIKSNINLRRGL